MRISDWSSDVCSSDLARSQNRIRAMVEGRPDWVISRQRAWGVPIALYVNRSSGEYLADRAVNERIVQAFKTGGADAWFTGDHQALLGPDYKLADYEQIGSASCREGVLQYV